MQFILFDNTIIPASSIVSLRVDLDEHEDSAKCSIHLCRNNDEAVLGEDFWFDDNDGSREEARKLCVERFDELLILLNDGAKYTRAIDTQDKKSSVEPYFCRTLLLEQRFR